jgi:hypothetical protein
MFLYSSFKCSGLPAARQQPKPVLFPYVFTVLLCALEKEVYTDLDLRPMKMSCQYMKMNHCNSSLEF